MRKIAIAILFVFTFFYLSSCSSDSDGGGNSSVSSNTCVITFQANGGTIATNKQTVMKNATACIMRVSALGLTHETKSFAGWGLSPSAKKASYYDGSEIYLSSDITLYALWNDSGNIFNGNSYYTVNYYPNGGIISTNIQKVARENPQTPVSVKLKTAAELGLLRDGYEFVGWSTWGTLLRGDVEYTNGATCSIISDLYLYAMWRVAGTGDDYGADAKTFTLTFDPNGGEITTATQSVTTTSSSAPITIKTIEELGLRRDGYDFAYWTTAEGTVYRPGDSISLSKDRTISAYWYPKTFKLVYDTNASGAVYQSWPWHGLERTNLVTTIDSKATKDVAIELYKPGWYRFGGYVLVGYSTNQNATEEEIEYTVGQENVFINADTTLYAVWAHDVIETTGANFATAISNMTRSGTVLVKGDLTAAQIKTANSVMQAKYKENKLFRIVLDLSQSTITEIPEGKVIGGNQANGWISTSFYDCDCLEEVIFPSCLQRICQAAFYLCDSLYKVTVPANVNYIGSQALFETKVGYSSRWPVDREGGSGHLEFNLILENAEGWYKIEKPTPQSSDIPFPTEWKDEDRIPADEVVSVLNSGSLYYAYCRRSE